MQSDLLLIQQLQEGNAKALSSLYDKYAGALYGVILRICKDEGKAQDVLQETFLKIWNNASSYKADKGRFYTWAYRIARNTALNEVRSPSKLIQTEDLGVYKETEVSEEVPVDVAKLNGSIRQLESHHQKALELVYFNGLTHREAHEEMGVPLGTFKSYVQQALRKLRELYGVEMILMIGVLIEWML
ncbi:RNA polymerase sigma factor [Aureisphaera galaxeae]|uniref:RNA polymerase sigma factor n=1 Tax=Aureisphaera galaxeae TaxID=1538023 RepID=UPI00234FEEDD|nr:RNA polymerase sigma factor [Aureisphaera galaxeae]MDC8004948.1 RNA polymerase sigma factor [Aureisphaera galaxeae]